MADSAFEVFFNLLNKVFMAAVTCTIAFGGATVGTVMGIIKGPTTETGLVRGACVGAITGAITAMQVREMIVNGEQFSKVSLLRSLINGEIYTEWVGPSLLKAYQWQVGEAEISFVDLFDGFESNESKGLSEITINKLPRCIFWKSCKEIEKNGSHESNCAICLRSFKNREEGRELPICKHVYHLECIDEWLIRSGSCPTCRRDV